MASVFFGLASQIGRSIFLCTLLLVFLQFFKVYVVYMRPLSTEKVLTILLITLVFLMIAIFTNMAILYLQESDRKLELANSSHEQLLNGMHEGVLILSH